MNGFSNRLAPLTRQNGKTSLTKRKTSKTLRKIEIFAFGGVLKQRLSMHYQNAPSPTQKTHGSPKISIFLKVFDVFRSVKDVFLFVLWGVQDGLKKQNRNTHFQKIAKTIRKITISSYILSFFVGEVCCGGRGCHQKTEESEWKLQISLGVFFCYFSENECFF